MVPSRELNATESEITKVNITANTIIKTICILLLNSSDILLDGSLLILQISLRKDIVNLPKELDLVYPS